MTEPGLKAVDADCNLYTAQPRVLAGFTRVQI